MYKPVVDSDITDEWLANSVARRISDVFGNNVGVVLGKELLWVCFESPS